MQSGRRHSTVERRISSTEHEDESGADIDDRLYDAGEHPAGHLAMAAAMNPEVDAWRCDAKFVEEDFRHLGVEMLPGMQHDLLDIAALSNRARDRCRLDELWSGADHAQNAVAAHSAAARNSGRKRACCNMQCRIVSRLERVQAIVS